MNIGKKVATACAVAVGATVGATVGPLAAGLLAFAAAYVALEVQSDDSSGKNGNRDSGYARRGTPGKTAETRPNAAVDPPPAAPDVICAIFPSSNEELVATMKDDIGAVSENSAKKLYASCQYIWAGQEAHFSKLRERLAQEEVSDDNAKYLIACIIHLSQPDRRFESGPSIDLEDAFAELPNKVKTITLEGPFSLSHIEGLGIRSLLL